MMGIAAGILLWVLFWLRVAHETVFRNARGIFTGIETNYGDLSENSAFTQYFAWGAGDLHNPLWSGILYRHHFLANLLASFFVKAGFDVNTVFQFETFLFGLLMTFLFGVFVKRFTGSTKLAWLSPILLLTAGSFMQIFEPQAMNGKIVWQNFLITRIMPQRAYLLGMPALCAALILLWNAWNDSSARRWLWAGIVTCLMPAMQIFNFLGVAFSGGILSLMKGPRAFFSFAVPIAVLALPQVYFLSHHEGSRDLVLITGWYESFKKGPLDFALFWLRNTGTYWPAILCSLPFLQRKQLFFYLPFLPLFIIGNAVLLTPDVQNNYNLMYVWMTASIPLVLILLQRLWNAHAAGKVLAVLVFLSLSAGGIRQLQHWLADKPGPYMVISAEEDTFSRELRDKTGPDELVLIYPIHNHPVYWSGRKVFMGYAGWVWSHRWGNYREREQIAKTIYENGPDAMKHIRDYGIDIIVIGPRERRAYILNEVFIQSISEKILSSGLHTAYRIRR